MTMRTDILDQFAALSRPVRARLAKMDKAELEQAYLRVLIVAAIVVYVACFAMATHSIGAGTLLFVLAYFAAALVIVLTIWAWPVKSTSRQILGIVVDVGALTWGLWALGEGGAVVVGAYLFFTLGNGFRYGRLHLHITQSLSVLGFAFVILSVAWWREHMAVAVGFFYILMVIPFYVSVLAERMKAALWNAQHALEECRRDQDGGAEERSSEASGG